ncbi:class I SAM-dependent methyltransferase [Streptomyces griseorubiginosus]|uniref:class I SAM-dependent methyltransferase n=1 Tax=Streptomyces griseorubiginosus TaxID=67304 RepID=UPI002E812A57|nr:class I SAM-dependent methyltransferase [Streptomyces griseorubiginosus]WUB44737.1 class I SAM-dependent methyltransferase [Streptomyces griseorubiginosus]WUB53254.1 class I SAM-dependent methyltransferase [Streptomyces griseorubiginosus]
MNAETPDFIRATRTAYDTIAEPYTAQFSDWAGIPTLDRAQITGFAELVKEQGRGPVADIGSGPGHVTAALHDLGVPVFGVDVSPKMVELARRAHPNLRFHVGSMTSLDLPSETLGGITALYSIIHVPDDHLPQAFAEFHRVLAPGTHALIGFQYEPGGTHMHLDERFGHRISLDYWLRAPEAVAALLAKAGLEVVLRVLREPLSEEKLSRAYLVARKPA